MNSVKTQYDVSVIIPVYNCEKYIKKCIDSIYKQNTKLSYEIIVVNDGSSDDSECICQTFIDNDNFKYCYKENSGVSEARNTGIELSTGKYIIFIDGDDYVLPDYLDNIVGLAFENDLDISVGGCQILYEKDNSKIINSFKEEKIYTGADDLKSAIKNFGSDGLLNIAVSKCFKREIINKFNLRYNKKISSGEDLCFNSEYLKYINNIGFSDDISYCYVRRDVESGVNSYKSNIIHMTETCLNAVKDLYKYYNLDDEKSLILLGNFYIDYISNGIYNLYRKNCKLSVKEKRNVIKKLYSLDEKKLNSFNDRKDILSKISTYLIKLDNAHISNALYFILFFIRNNFSSCYYWIRNKWIHKGKR